MKQAVKESIKKFLKKHGYALMNINELNANSIENAIGNIDICEKNKEIINLENIPFSKEDFNNRNKETIVVNWIIPPLGIGSGGHLNIFRAIDHIGHMGIKSKVYIYGGNEGTAEKDLREFVKTYYKIELGNNEIFPSVKLMEYSDAVIATSWNTAYIANRFDNTISKFYFVQDFEPFFFPVGSKYYLAENTYKFGFRGITAGDWLKEKLNKEYGMVTESFKFSYDKDLYRYTEKKDNKNRIFFYARPYTERRAFEIGVMAFTLLAKKIPDVEIVFAGQKLDNYKFDFNYKDLGIVEINELCDIYSQCDMCLVLSSTNLSLLPMEVMASNSVVVSNYGANNEWLLNEDNAILVNPDPIEIAEKLEYYLNNNHELELYRKNAVKYVEDISWDKEFQKVYKFIKESVECDIKQIRD